MKDTLHFASALLLSKRRVVDKDKQGKDKYLKFTFCFQKLEEELDKKSEEMSDQELKAEKLRSEMEKDMKKMLKEIAKLRKQLEEKEGNMLVKIIATFVMILLSARKISLWVFEAGNKCI